MKDVTKWLAPTEAKEGEFYQVRYSSGFVGSVPYTKARIDEANNDPEEPRKVIGIATWPYEETKAPFIHLRRQQEGK